MKKTTIIMNLFNYFKTRKEEKEKLNIVESLGQVMYKIADNDNLHHDDKISQIRKKVEECPLTPLDIIRLFRKRYGELDWWIDYFEKDVQKTTRALEAHKVTREALTPLFEQYKNDSKQM